MSDSDDDEEDLFAMPGQIKKRAPVAADEMSSDDDCGTNALLKSGQAKKDALKEKERLKNLRTQVEGTKPSDGSAQENEKEVVDVDDVQQVPAPADDAPPSKRAKRDGKRAVGKQPGGSRGGGSSSTNAGGGGASPITLDEEDRELVEREQAQRQKQARELQKFRRNLALDDDDDDDDEAETRPAAARTQTGKARGAAGATAGAPRKTWLTVHTDGVDKTHLVSVASDAPLTSSELRRKAAELFGLDEQQTVFKRGVVVGEDLDSGAKEVQPGEILDLSRTPNELFASAGPSRGHHIWAEEAAVQTLTLVLRYQGDKQLRLPIAQNGTFGELLQRFCAKAGGGLTTQRCSLVFDGDVLNAQETPKDHELEDGDLIEVHLR